MKSYVDHLASLEATRAEKFARMKALQQVVMDEDRTFNTAEDEEFSTLDTEIKALDQNIARTKTLQALDVATATPVDGTTKAAAIITAPTQLARAGSDLTLKTVEKLEPGIMFARYAMCLLNAKGDKEKAFKLAEKFYPQTECVVKTLKAQSEGADLEAIMKLKASVSAGNTTDTTWAAPLVYANTFGGDFVAFLRPRTLIGQAQFRPVPFNVRIGGQTSGGTGYWVGQGKGKPVTKFDFNAQTTQFTKAAAIAVITEELARFSDPNAETLVRDSLADAVIARLDQDLFDPDVAAVANVNPAGLLNGVAPVAGPSGTVDEDSIRCALLRLWAPWDSTNLGARPAYYTTPAAARNLAFMRNALGQPAFPGVTADGRGNLDGIPIRTSQYLANNGGSQGNPFILVDEAEVWLADDGSVTVDTSTEASIEMVDAPTQNANTPTASTMVSMFTTNSIALRAERFIWWGLRRSGAIQWIDGFPGSC